MAGIYRVVPQYGTIAVQCTTGFDKSFSKSLGMCILYFDGPQDAKSLFPLSHPLGSSDTRYHTPAPIKFLQFDLHSLTGRRNGCHRVVKNLDSCETI